MRRRAACAISWVIGATVAGPVHAETEAWFDRIDFRSDFRLRYEAIDREGSPKRERTRYRARAGFDVDLYDDVTFVLALATAADNPVSRNVTFGSGESSNLGVDFAYVDWRAADNTHVVIGKLKNPFYHPGSDQLVYDNDLNPGGVAATWAPGPWFLAAGAFQVEERGSADDTHLYHVEGGARWKPSEQTSLAVGAGYFAYTNIVGNTPIFFGLPLGNTVDADGRYVYDYRNVEVFGELATTLGGWPFSAFVHYTENLEVDNEEAAYAVGVNLGKAGAQGTYQVGWHYKDLEADAVIGSYTDSDFGGGGTDVQGHVFRGRYMLRDRIALSGTFFLNETGAFRGDERDYRRLQLDVEFKFD